MLSVKNRGIGISMGGADTSLMMMKTYPEIFTRVPVYVKSANGYSNGARTNGKPVEIIQEVTGVSITPKTFACIEGYTQKSVDPQEG